MSDQTRVCIGATIGALIGAAATYLFFTERGRGLRDQLEPALDDARREFVRFQKTIEKVGDLANDGMRMVAEFNAARTQAAYPTDHTSH